MTKQEIEKSIKNGEPVWYVDDINEKIFQVDLDKRYAPQMFEDFCLYVFRDLNSRYKNEYFIERLFATKQQAKHYLCHANVTRTETLPFLTWEEFLKEREISFKDYEDYNVYLFLSKSEENINLFCLNLKHQDKYYKATEANFYKAYDECVRLFKGEV